MRHTQGEWKFFDNDKAMGITTKKGDIAWTQVPSAGLINLARTKDEDIANTYLMSAAPELLDALQKMCEVMDEGYGDIAKQLVRDMAQAAINKATGETQ